MKKIVLTVATILALSAITFGLVNANKKVEANDTAKDPVSAATTPAVTSTGAATNAQAATKRHRVFGRGEIIRIDRDVIEIRFSKGVKRLSVGIILDMGLLEPEQ